MKQIYESEIINNILEQRGHEKSSLHYQSECTETWIEENKGSYPKLCDYESEWLCYINENPIGEFPYETITNVTDASVNNVVPFAYQSAILKGNTIINLVNNFTFGTGVKETDNYFTLTQTNTAENIGVNIETSLIELNKDYTLIYFIQEKTTTVSTSLVIKQASYLAPSGNATITQNIGWNKIKFNLSSFGSTRGLNIAIASSEQDGNYIKFAKNKFALLAGDWTNKNIPFNTVKYGMQSVKMPVLTTTGKNLFDISKEQKNITININNGDTDTKTNDRNTSDFIKVIPNTIYKCNVTMTRMAYYDKNKQFISHNTSVSQSITIPSSCNFVKFSYDNALTNIQFEQGSKATSYEPYKSIILTVNEDVTLRSNGSVCDELDLLTGKLTQRIDEDGEILAKEVIKTVDLIVTNQDGESLTKIIPIEGTMNISTDGTPIKPTITMEIPVEAIVQNLASFIEEE